MKQMRTAVFGQDTFHVELETLKEQIKSNRLQFLVIIASIAYISLSFINDHTKDSPLDSYQRAHATERLQPVPELFSVLVSFFANHIQNLDVAMVDTQQCACSYGQVLFKWVFVRFDIEPYIRPIFKSCTQGCDLFLPITFSLTAIAVFSSY